MIERVYIDNYVCLVNFEWRPGKVALLLGENGSGKSTVLDALSSLRTFIIDEADVESSFGQASRTRWDSRSDQTFEVDIRDGKDLIRYKLVLRYNDRNDAVVHDETVSLFDHTVSRFNQGELWFETGSRAPVALRARPGRSSVPTITAASDEGPVHALVDALDSLWVLRPDPRAMSGMALETEHGLEIDCSNFASWWRAASGTSPEGIAAAREDLAEAFGLVSLGVLRNSRRFSTRFETNGSSYSIDFDDLSDGQRQLIVLYTVLRVVAPDAMLMCFDEPDNYVALREIQPWLSAMIEAAEAEGGPQVWFISHHPELLNQLAPDRGVRFFRDGGPTRIEPFRGVDGLNSAEVVARGWDNG